LKSTSSGLSDFWTYPLNLFSFKQSKQHYYSLKRKIPMKKFKLSLVAMLLLAAVACKKTDNSASVTGNVSSADAADLVAGSLSLNSNGVANVSDDATLTASSMTAMHLSCGTTKSDSVSRHSTSTVSPYTYSYNLKYSYTLNCNNNVPDNLSSSLVYSGSFSGPHISSTNSGSAIFTVAGLSPTANNFVINGEYKRSGSFKSKIDTAKAGNSNIDIVVTALTLRKPARTIASGTATISITGNVPKKGNFSYTGTLVFNGDGTATLTINGTVYTINLTTGERVKV
jgi:hypothetical protein